MGLHRALGEDEAMGHTGVAEAFGHEPEHLSLAWGELLKGGPVADHETGDDLGVQC